MTTAATAEALTTAEAGILKGIASAALAQEAEAEARRLELAEAERQGPNSVGADTNCPPRAWRPYPRPRPRPASLSRR